METKTTLRLREIDKNSIANIKDLSGEVTDAGAIRYALTYFSDLNNRFLSEQKRNQKLKEEIKELNEVVTSFNSFVNALNNINLKGK